MSHLKLALRSLRRRPGSSLLIAAMLAVAIAGNTAIFSLVHSLLLAPLPFEEPERLVYLDETAPAWNLELVSIAYADFDAWRSGSRSFDAMAVHRDVAFNLSLGDTLERIDAARVTHDLARVLGVRTALGRGFTEEDDRPGAPRVTLLGHGLWRRLFAGDPQALGRTLRLDGELYTVVGVLPPELRFPADAQLWVPAAEDPEESFGTYAWEGVGRLRPGVSPALAKGDLDRALLPLIEQYPFKEAVSSVVRPLQEHLVAGAQQTALALLGAVVLVLLVACSNVAALMLAAGVARQREIGVRLALGAGRFSLVRQALLESLVLAAVGGAAGLLIGGQALRALGTPLLEHLPFWVELTPSPAALGICFGAGLLTTLVFGIWPALATSSVGVAGVIGASTGRTSPSRGRQRALAGLVAGEMALAQALLVGAGLVALSQQRLLRVDPGYRTEGVLSFRLALPETQYPDGPSRVALFRELRDRLAALPGVEATALVSNAPLQGHDGYFFQSEDDVGGGDEVQRPVTLTRYATPGYLEALDIPLLRGRDLRAAADSTQQATEVVVNRTFAELYWPGRDAVGRRIRTGDLEWLRVVGVAADVQHYGVGEEMRPGVYLPLDANTPASMGVVLTSRTDPLGLVNGSREVVRSLDPELPLHRVTTLESDLSRSLATRRATATLFALFAAVALVLAAAGAFGVVSDSVVRRRRELGVRLALGALPRQLLALVLRQGLAAAGLGAAVGLGVALALGRGLEALLFDVDPHEPGVLVGVSVLLLATAALANLLPAWRASRLPPMVVLRDD